VPGRSHRLLCGDATSAEDVARLMGDAKAAVLWTDPPYGVDYVGKTADALTLENDHRGRLADLLAQAFTTLDAVLADGAAVYVAHPAGGQCLVFGNAFVAGGWRFRQDLVWVKDTMVLGHSDYHYRHEGIYYGHRSAGDGRPGRGDHPGSHWVGGHAKTSVFEIERPKRSEEHPTIKPAELVLAQITNHGQTGDVVLDGFVGSGTAIVAAEQAARLCCALEIDPAYVAVILERLAGMGLEPRLLEPAAFVALQEL
jgi:DNA modification methylase